MLWLSILLLVVLSLAVGVQAHGHGAPPHRGKQAGGDRRGSEASARLPAAHGEGYLSIYLYIYIYTLYIYI